VLPVKIGLLMDNNTNTKQDKVAISAIDIAALPLSIQQSPILTKKNLEQLAGVHCTPMIDPAFDDDTLKNIIQYYSISPDEMEMELHIYAARLLNEGKVDEAWQVLLALN
jgi:hypothetical protein